MTGHWLRLRCGLLLWLLFAAFGFVSRSNIAYDGHSIVAAKGPVRAFEVGTADDLLARSIRGDKLDIHHVGQAHPLEQIIPGYNRATAPAIAVPQNPHRTIPTVRGPYTGTARDQLAKDIRDLRNYTDAPNSSLRELIDLNKQTYPNAFQK